MVEHVIGIDPDRDRITAAVVDTATTGEQATAVFETTQVGYDRLLEWVERHTTSERVWSVEGTGSYGAGVAAYLIARGEMVTEFNHPTPTRDGAKTDALDAGRAARQVLGRSWPSTPRARGDREALRVLATTRRGAQTAPSIGYQRTKSPGSNSTGRPQRPTPRSQDCCSGDQMLSVSTPTCNHQRTHRHQTSHAFCSPTDPNSLHRGSRTANTHHRTGHSRRPPVARPVRNRADHRRAGIHRLVPPPPMPQRSRVRSPRRCSTPSRRPPGNTPATG